MTTRKTIEDRIDRVYLEGSVCGVAEDGDAGVLFDGTPMDSTSVFQIQDTVEEQL